jgi:hypothetical protein
MANILDVNNHKSSCGFSLQRSTGQNFPRIRKPFVTISQKGLDIFAGFDDYPIATRDYEFSKAPSQVGISILLS